MATHRWVPRGHLATMVVGSLALAMAMAGLIADVYRSNQQAVTLAEQVSTECGAGKLAGNICDTAQKVITAPGPPGATGPEGRGIVSTAIDGRGHLIVAYSDRTTSDVGAVVGRQGEQGVGIASTTITDGRLTLIFSDGSTRDVGRIVGERGQQGVPGPTGGQGETGPRGLGIKSTDNVAGRLVVTYDDGTTQDAGPLPPGTPGPACPGSVAPKRFTVLTTDGPQAAYLCQPE